MLPKSKLTLKTSTKIVLRINRIVNVVNQKILHNETNTISNMKQLTEIIRKETSSKQMKTIKTGIFAIK